MKVVKTIDEIKKETSAWWRSWERFRSADVAGKANMGGSETNNWAAKIP